MGQWNTCHWNVIQSGGQFTQLPIARINRQKEEIKVETDAMIHCFASACSAIDRTLIGPVNSSRLICNLQIELSLVGFDLNFFPLNLHI
jgi:hypothetical protein